MEKFRRISTHNLMVERMNGLESKSRPVCFKLFRKAPDDSEIIVGSAEIVSIAVDVQCCGKGAAKEARLFFEVNRMVCEESQLVYCTDIGSFKDGLSDEHAISRLVEMACELLCCCDNERAIPNFNHADFLKSMGFPYSIAVRVGDDGHEDEDGMYCLINRNYDVICESPSLAQVQSIRDALNTYTNRDLF